MQFKIWPFGAKERPVLYWMTSPRKTDSGWVMDAVFKRQSGLSPRLVRVEVPWGTLPYLRIGRTYHEKGRLDEASKSGLESKLVLSPKHIGKVIPAHSMLRELRSFYGDHQLAEEMVWVITAGYKTYYIPCLELIRAFLASSVYMANHLLFPTSIEDMVSEEEVANNALEMVLNPRIPKTIVNNSTAFHIAWLRHNPAARQMWNGILANQRHKARAGHWPTLESALRSGVPIECEMPNDTKYIINYRGFYSGDNWFVQEIISVEGFDIPFEEVRYSHPLLDIVRFEDDEDNVPKTRVKKVETGQEHELDNHGGAAKSASFQPRIVSSTVEFLAKKRIRMKRVSNKERTTKGNKDTGVRDWGPSHRVTTQDSRCDGTLQPIEVRSISLVDYYNLSLENREGLKDFLEMVNLLQELRPDLKVQVEFVPLPEGTRISRYPSGERRMCAVVELEWPSNVQIWIIEIARPDRWQISTLLVGEPPYGTSNGQSLKLNLIRTDGHWDSENFETSQCPIITRIRHTDSGIKRWAGRIIEKIG